MQIAGKASYSRRQGALVIDPWAERRPERSRRVEGSNVLKCPNNLGGCYNYKESTICFIFRCDLIIPNPSLPPFLWFGGWNRYYTNEVCSGRL